MKKVSKLYYFALVFLFLTVFLIGCQPVPEPKPPTVIPPSTDKGIYSNSRYGFSFNTCSKEFEVKENYQGYAVAILGPLLGKELKHQIGIFVYVAKDSGNTKLEDFLASHKKAGETTLTDFAISRENDTEITGITAKLLEFSYSLDIDDEKWVFQDVMISFKKDSYIYAIKYDVPAEFHQQYRDCFDRIISTLKFS